MAAFVLFVKTPARFTNDLKIRVQKDAVETIRILGQSELLRRMGHRQRRDLIRIFLSKKKKLWAEMEGCDLVASERLSHLNKVAFPDFNHEGVDAALKAGNNLNDLYALACGRAFITKDGKGNYVIGTKGHLKIQRHTLHSIL